MAKGGARTGAGRKKLKPELSGDIDKLMAIRVLARVGKPGWTDYVDIRKVKSAEDFALHLLVEHPYAQFHRLWNRAYGKEVQRVRIGNPEGEKLKLEVDVTSARDKLISKLL
jgi:hypothetical protein